jgi:hypothetical protein
VNKLAHCPLPQLLVSFGMESATDALSEICTIFIRFHRAGNLDRARTDLHQPTLLHEIGENVERGDKVLVLRPPATGSGLQSTASQALGRDVSLLVLLALTHDAECSGELSQRLQCRAVLRKVRFERKPLLGAHATL